MAWLELDVNHLPHVRSNDLRSTSQNALARSELGLAIENQKMVDLTQTEVTASWSGIIHEETEKILKSKPHRLKSSCRFLIVEPSAYGILDGRSEKAAVPTHQCSRCWLVH